MEEDRCAIAGTVDARSGRNAGRVRAEREGGTAKMSTSKRIEDRVAAAKAQIRNLTPQQAREEVDRGALLVDLRESEELAESGRIAGALHAPRGMLEWYADPESRFHLPELRRDRPIVLTCAGGGRSALAALTLREMGFEDVSHLESGFNGWKDAGMPVEGGAGS